jgi:hypothetical protein
MMGYAILLNAGEVTKKLGESSTGSGEGTSSKLKVKS